MIALPPPVRPALEHVTRFSQAVGGFAVDAGQGFAAEATTVGRDMASIVRLMRAQGVAEGASLVRQGVGQMRSQGSIGQTLKDEFVTPVVSDFQAGRHGHAVGRGVFLLASSILPGDKIIRATAAIAADSSGT